jgi:hypothetical protein
MGGKGGRCVRLTTLPPSCAECLQIWEPQPPGTLRACPGIALPLPLLLYKQCNKYNWVLSYKHKNNTLWCVLLKGVTQEGNKDVCRDTHVFT